MSSPTSARGESLTMSPIIAKWAWKWPIGSIVLGVIDGALLGGVAAVLSTIFTFVLGLMAFFHGQMKGKKQASTEAEAWRLLAEARERELEMLREGQ